MQGLARVLLNIRALPAVEKELIAHQMFSQLNVSTASPTASILSPARVSLPHPLLSVRTIGLPKLALQIQQMPLIFLSSWRIPRQLLQLL